MMTNLRRLSGQSRSIGFPCLRRILVLVLLLGAVWAHGQATIELSVTPVSSAVAEEPIQLKATVTLDKTPVRGGGTVYFYDDASTPRLIGTAQMNAQGVASIMVRLNPGAHALSAYHPPENGLWGGPSLVTEFIVSATPLPTTTTFSETETVRSALLSAAVTGKGGNKPTGEVVFRNTNHPDTVLASTALGVASYGFATFVLHNDLGSSPGQIAIGDFDQDGAPDVAILNKEDDTVAVFRNLGNGAFSSGTVLATQHLPSAIAAADLNDDGNLDLIVANQGSRSYSIYYGNGDGTFSKAQSAPLDLAPQALAVADFNADGRLDFAVSSETESRIDFYSQNADGTFSKASEISDLVPRALIAADFDGDGAPDLIYANGRAKIVVVLLNGDLSLRSSTSYPIGSVALGLVAADFNGDGRPDIAATTAGQTIFVLNNGDGTLAAPMAGPVTANASDGIVAADFNHDGKLDIAVKQPNGKPVLIYFGDGAGNFSASPDLTLSTGLTHTEGDLVAVDFDGDGLPDLVVTPGFAENAFSVLLAQQSRIAEASLPHAAANGAASNVSQTISAAYVPGKSDPWSPSTSNQLARNASDIDRDSNAAKSAGGNTSTQKTIPAPAKPATRLLHAENSSPLVLIATTTTLATHASSVTAGTVVVLTATVTTTPGGSPVTPGIVKFYDSVATPTLVGTVPLVATAGASQGTAILRLRPGIGSTHNYTATLVANSTYSSSTSSAQSVTVTASANFYSTATAVSAPSPAADAFPLNGTVTAFGLSLPPGTVSFADTSNGNASLGSAALTADAIALTTATTNTAATSVLYGASGDFNGDGIPDVVFAGGAGTSSVEVYLGNANGTLSAPTTYTVGSNPCGVVVGDFNQDGKLDIAVTNRSSGTVSILLGNGNGTFQTAVNYTVGTTPLGIVAGDFNNDGILDLAVANSASATISLLLGTGTGTFGAQTTFAVGTTPYQLAAADFIGNGNLDLSVANYGSSTISVLLGNGAGSFATQVTYTADPSPYGIAIGDLNGDGKPDLVVNNSAVSTISVFVGNGDGTFAAKADYLTPAATGRGVAIADVNLDGYLDVVTGGPQFAVFLGNGNGTLQTAQSFTSAGVPDFFALADLNGDGRPDIVVGNYSAATISTYLNETAATATITGPIIYGSVTHNIIGSYTPGVNDADAASTSATFALSGISLSYVTPPRGYVPAGAAPGTVTVNVMSAGALVTTATNVIQLTVTGPNSYSQTYTATSVSGTATFSSLPATATLGTYTYTADFYGAAPTAGLTTASEIVSALGTSSVTLAMSPASPQTAGTVIVLTATISNGGNPATQGIVKFYDSALTPTLVGTAAIVASGASQGTATLRLRPGLNTHSYTATLVANASYPTATSSAQSLTVNPPTTLYTPTVGIGSSGAPAAYTLTGTVTSFGASLPPGTVAFQDTSNSNAVVASSALTSDTVTLAAPVNYTNPSYYIGYGTSGDFNGDGIPDIVFPGYYYSTNVAVYLGNANGTLSAATTNTAGSYPYAVAVGDFNQDGKLDFAVTNYNSANISVFLGNGNGTFQSAVSYAVGSSPVGIVAGDFNNDGILDLAVANDASGTVSILLGTGAGTFGAQTTFAVANGPNMIAAADLIGNGNLDLVTANYAYGNVSVLLGNGAGSFAGAVTYSADTEAIGVAIGDLNGDGKPDLVVSNANSAEVSVFLGTGTGTFNAKVDYPTGSTGGRQVAVADVNLDGKLDVVVGTTGTQFSVLLGNGNGTLQTPQTFAVTTGEPAFLAIADLNGDGRPDIVTGDYAGSAVSVFLNETVASTSVSGPIVYGTTTHNVNASYVPGANDADAAATSASTAALNGVSLNYAAPPAASVHSGTAPGTVAVNVMSGGAQVTTATNVIQIAVTGPNSYSQTYTAAAVAGTATFSSLPATPTTGTYTYTADFYGAAPTAGAATAGEVVNALSVTSTSLSMTPSSPQAAGTVITLVATVTSSGSPVTPGIVKFYDSALTPTLVGSVPLIATAGSSQGTATLKLRPGINFNHSYTATLVGNSTYGTSTSLAQSLVVNPPSTLYSTTTGITSSGAADAYTLTGSVTAFGASLPPGTISFKDTSNSNALVGTAALTANTVTLTSAVTSTAPQYVAQGASGDFNGDGIPDVVFVGGTSANTISVYLGNANGTLSAPTTYAVGSNSSTVVVGDFNQDGKLDIAVTNGGSNTVSVLLGNGNGTFQTQVTYATGTAPSGIVAGDFNNDGILDLAVANNSSGTVSLLLGTGSGTFGTQTTFAVGTSPAQMAAADLIGNGNLDLAVANAGSNTISVLIGNGAGSFAAQATYTASSGPFGIAIGDINGDGKPDVVVSNNGVATVSVFLGTGTGTLNAKTDYADGATGGRQVGVADFNLDGNLDVVEGPYGSTAFSILLGNGNGTLQSAQNFTSTGSPSYFTLPDLNGDGRPDIVMGNYGSSTISVYLNETVATGSTTPAGPIVYGTGTHNVNASYVPGTNDSDAASTSAGTVALSAVSLSYGTSPTASVFSGTGPGTVTVKVMAAGAQLSTATNLIQIMVTGPSYQQTYYATAVAGLATFSSLPATTPAGTYTYTADFGSAAPTAGLTIATETVVALPTVSLAISPSSPQVGGTVLTLTATALNNAGAATAPGTVRFYDSSLTPTLIGTMPVLSSGVNTGTATIRIRPGVGTHSYTAVFVGPASQGTSAATSVQSFVITQPTYKTVSSITATGSATAYTLTGAEAAFGLTTPTGSISFTDATNSNAVLGTATPASWVNGVGTTTLYTAGSTATDVAVGDFNGDGIPDIAVTNYASNTISVFLGNGDGSFQAGVTYATGTGPFAIATADFNGDGKLDLVVGNFSGANVSVLLGNGNGTFQTAVNYAVGTTPKGIAIADFNLDGILDLAVTNFGSNTISILLGTGSGTFGTQTTIASAANPYRIVTADFNLDGKPDLAWTNSATSGTVSVALGNGNGTFQTPVTFTVGNDPVGVAAADVNGDGKPDLIVGNYNSNTVSVLLGNGAGSFATQVTYPDLGGANSVVVADLYNTGTLDIACNTAASTVAVLLGNGNGTFGTATSYAMPAATGGFMTSADLNGDGKIDLVSASYSNSGVTVALSGLVGTASISPEVVYGNSTHSVNSNYVPGSSDSYGSSTSATPVSLVGLYASFGTSPAATVPSGTGPGTVTVKVMSAGAQVATATNVMQLVVTGPNSYSQTYTATAVAGLATFSSLPATTAAGTYTYTADFNVAAPTLGLATATEVVLGAPTITLAMTPASPQTAGTVITLTATVTNTLSNPVVPGIVKFYDSAATPTLVGTMPLIATAGASQGTATIRLRPGIKTHSYTATVVANTTTNSATSSAQSLTVTAPSTLYLTTTGITSSGSADAYTLTGSVTAFGVSLPPGTLSFKDTSNSNAVVGSAALTASTVTLATAATYTAAANVVDSVTGDFNGDGIPDVVVTNFTTANTVSVYLGNANGTLSAPVSYAVGSEPLGVAVGDFNQDGKLDLAVTNFTGNTVSILLGNGNGTFQTAVSYAAGTGPNGIVAGDFNNDGILDLAIASQSGTSISLLLGTGTGTFGAQTTFTVGTTPYFLAAGDFIGNGNLDLAVANSASNTISVLIGNGAGSFASAVNYTASSTPLGIAVADMNGDGKLDLVVNNSGVATVSVFLGTGTGTFNPKVDYAVPATGGRQLAVADLNLDGNVDVVAGNTGSAFSILLGNGNGTLQTAQSFAATAAASYFSVGDLNGDGRPDIIMGDLGSSEISVFLNETVASGSTTPAGPIVYGTGAHNVNASYVPGTTDGDAASTSAGTVALNAISLSYGIPPTASVVSGTAPGTVTLKVMAAGAQVTTATNVIQLVVTGPNSYSQTYTSTAVAGVATFSSLPATGAPGTYTYTADFAAAAPTAGLATATEIVTTAISLGPASLSFASQGVGSNSSGHVVTVTNQTAGTITLTTIALTGANSSEFSKTTTCGATLAASGTCTVTVTFSPVTVGSKTAALTLTDSAADSPQSAAITATATQGTPVITWANPSSIVYGTALSATQLNATTNVAGTFVYTPAAGAVLGAGSQTLSVTFTPTDTTDYTTATTTATLTVTQAMPTITWANPAAVSYGTVLSSTQLNATASVPGTFVYTPTAGTTPATGSDTLSVAFTPTDTTDYTAASAIVTLTVNKATPAITWATPAAISYGTVLSSIQLNASASVPGTFVYTPAAGTTPATGSDTLSVVFTPTDTTDYTAVSATVTLTVNKATPTITWANPAAISYGTVLSSTQLNATASVPGTFVYTPAAGTTPATGSDTLSVAFTPTDTTDYTTATTTATLTVTQATPVMTWANPSSIVYGTALSSTQLNATANVAGTFVYTPAAGAVLGAGSQMLSVTFTPTDTTDYTTTSATVTLTVNKATPTITWATPAAISYGTVLSSTQLNATASVPGTFVYTPTAGTTPATGSDTLSVAFTPTDTTDYTTASATVTLTVNKAVPTVTWANPSSIVYGTALSAAQLNATANVAGAFVYTPAAGMTPATGSDTLSVAFTPTDTTDYTTASASVTLTVNQAVLTITANPASRAYGAANPTFTYTPTGFVNGDNASVLSGAPSFSTTANTLSGAGTYTISITPGSLTAANYTFNFVNGVLTVNQAATTTSVASSANPSTVGNPILFSATVTSSGPASGTVAFLDGSTTLGTGTLGSGTATFSTSALTAGSHSITAVYSGDTSSAASTSPVLTQVVQASTSTALTVNVNPAAPGTSVSFVATVSSTSGTPDGTVTFLDGTTTLGSSALNGSGSATYSTSTLATGSHSITAVYSGSGSYLGSTSAVLTETIQQTSSLTINSSGSPSQPGSAVTFTAQVTATTVPPTGSVSFLSGGQLLGTGTLNGSAVATFTTSSLALGPHVVTATYPGDANTLPAVSGPITQSVQQLTTNTLGSSAAVSIVGASVTFTAVVAGASATPTGSVTFEDASTILGTGTLDGSGSATFSTSTLTMGVHSISAIYGGDDNSQGSTSLVLTQTVQETTATTVVSNSNPSLTGTSVTFTATVSTAGSGTPTGTVTFLDGTTVIGAGTLNGSSEAVLVITSLANGSHAISAVYNGDTADLGSTSPVLTQNVQAITSTPLISSSNPSISGQSITLTATVVPAGSFTPTGTITFEDGGATLSVQALSTSGGVTSASFSTAAMAAGTHSLTAVYSGDAHNAGSTSPVLSQIVEASTSVTLISSLNPSLLGSSITLSASVPAGANGQPTGTVTFMDGGNALGAGTLDGSGNTSWTLSTLALGQHSLTAVYSGDSLNATSTSAVLTQTVQESTVTTLLANANPAQPGTQAIFTATVTTTGSGTPAGIVTFLDGTTILGTGTLTTSSGVATATFATSSLAVGSHSITASYAGNAGNAASVSPALTESIEQTTTVTISSSSNPALAGTSVTLSATVLPAGSVTPTGTVTFSEGSTVLGESALNGSGVGSIQVSNLSPAQNSITASYSGDADNAGGTSTVFVQTIQQNTTIVLASSVNPSLSGTAITLTASVTPAISGSPTGVVTFNDGGTAIGTGNVNASGVATLLISTLTVGSHSITAVYGGDAIDLTSTSEVLTQEVQENTSIALTSSNNPAGTGAFVTFTVTASGFSQTPTGTVTFNDGATVLGTGTMNGSGISTFSTSGLGAGSHSIVASYGGDSNNLPANSNALTQIILANTTTALGSAPNPSIAGASVTFTATVTSSFAGTPTGTVTFLDGSTTIGSGAVNSSGIATYSTTALAAGTHSMTAVYSGDIQYAGSTSTVDSQEVQSVTSVALTSSLNPAPPGGAVIFTASVTGGAFTATGTVTFNNGSTTLGTGTLDGSGNATLATSSLASGPNSIVAVYAGDNNNLGSSSPALVEIVQANTTTVLTANPNPVSATASVTLTASVTGGFGTATGSITFKDGSAVLGTQTLNGSAVATFTTSSLAAGSHTLVAVYSGDSNNVASASLAIMLIVQASTTVSVISSLNPSSPGANVTFTATAASSNGIPTGTVNFQNGATLLGTATLNGSGAATFSTTSLPLGANSITAVYAGSTNYTGSTSAALVQSVEQTGVMTLTSSGSPSQPGSAVTFTAAITGTSPVATGTVTFSDGSVVLGTATLNGSGIATLTTSSLPLGTNTITASYGGDADTEPQNSNTLTQSVQQNTAVLLTTSNPVALATTAVTFTAAVSGPSITPTGMVTFLDGSNALATVNLTPGGQATYSTSSLTLGAHSIMAEYSGDANSLASASLALTQTIQESTTTTITSNSNPSQTGQPVTFSSTVTTTGTGIPTGSITYLDGTTVLGSATLNNSQQATFSISSLANGPHSITAVYSGDTANMASASTVLTQNVQASSSTPLVSSLNPSVAGQSITLTATVLPTGSYTPTGTITFEDSGSSIGTAVLSTTNGVTSASMNTSTLAAGTHSLTGVYSGDANNSPSTSPILDEVVEATSTVTLSGSGNPSLLGNSVTFTATVPAGALGQPTGTINFEDGSTTLGTSTLNGSGLATITTSSLSLGLQSMTAVYGGDSANAPSTSSPLSQDVQEQTQVQLASNINPSQPGASVTFTATVTATGPGTPTGVVTFGDGGTSLGTATLSTTNGVTTATFSTSALALGLQSITAAYAGDTQNAASTSPLFNESVAQTTTVSLQAAPNPAVAGSPVTLTATVTPSGSTSPTGTITFYDGTMIVGTAALSSGTASVTLSNLPPGAQTITASYSGDIDNVGSTSTGLTISIQQTTTTTLAANPNPSVSGSSVTLTATVAASITGTPTGSVSFNEGSIVLGTATLSGSGTATFSLATLAVGQNSIVAVYSGDTGDQPSTSSALTETVQQSSSMQLTTSGSPAAAGSFITFTATLAPGSAGIPTGSVTFMDGTTLLGTSTVSPAGVATFTTQSLGVGSHTIVANYGGDDDDLPDSATLTQLVLAATSTTVVSSPNPATPGATVNFTVTVGTTTGIATGTAILKDGTTTLATLTLNGSGIASYTTSTLAPGTHSITAVYSGDAIHARSTSAAVMEIINPGATTITLGISNPNPTLGSAVTLTATITGSAPTGTASFYDGTTLLGTTTLNGAYNASFTISSISAGSHLFTAVYSGDANNAGATSSPIIITVASAGASTAVSLSSSFNPSVPTAVVFFTAAVTGTGGIPTGTVTFLDGTVTLGSETLNASASTSFATGQLAAGSHLITAVYAGDSVFSGSTSSVLTESVVAPTGPAPSITLSVAQGEVQLRSTEFRSTAKSLLLPNPQIAEGTPVTITAVVAINNAPLTQGTVTFFDGTVALATVPTGNFGAPSFVVTLGAGPHSLSATYNGTNSTSASASLAITIIITPNISNVLNASGKPGHYTLAATITGDALIAPTGSVALVDGSNGSTLGQATVTPGSVQMSPVTAPGSPISITGTPALVTEGDFNGDQNADLAVIDSSANTVTILMGNGTGQMTVAASSPIALSGSPVRITSADFNGDSKDDLAIATSTGQVIILLSDGGGQFHAAASAPISANGTASIVSGDFTGTGIADLAIASTSGSVSIWMGDGAGNFSLAVGSPFTVNFPSAIAVGDFNQDGNLDLAITNATSNQISVLLGDGTGTFSGTAHSSFATGANPVAIAVGDFTGNGKLDLAIANQTFAGSSSLTILLGDGSGNFTAAAASPFALTGIPVALSAGPITGPMAGLAVANQGGTITVLQSDASGNFSQAAGSPISMSTSIASMVVKDFNNDGKLDFAALNAAGNSLIVELNRTISSSAVVATNIAVTGSGSHSVTAVYSGDSVYPATTSNAVTLMAATTPGFTVVSATTSQTIAPGQTASYAVSVIPQNAFTGTVTLSCSGLPTGYACNFAPASVILNSAPANTIMTISSTTSATVAPVGGALSWMELSHVGPLPNSPIWLFLGLAMFVLVITGKARTQGRMHAGRFACEAIMLVGISILPGCGNSPITPAPPGLSTKTYTITINGSSGALTRSTTVILVVKGAE
jgi:hypothetical protein